MNRSEQRLVKVKKAFSRLQTGVIRFTAFIKKPAYDEEDKLEKQDSVIKRFEFCYELVWKFLKDVLEEDHGIIAVSPKKVFHECFSTKIITEQESKVLLEIVNARNETSHIYDEDTAETICDAICKIYFPMMKSVIERFEKAN